MPIIKKCKKCGKQFKTKPFWVNQGKGVYCSNACSFASRRKGKVMPCFICGIESYKKVRALNSSKSKLFFCSKSCQTQWRNTQFTGPKHANWKGGRYTYRNILIKSLVNKKCEKCGTSDMRILAVHHVDKNRGNNKLENLSWLCHNCHHLVHHYK